MVVNSSYCPNTLEGTEGGLEENAHSFGMRQPQARFVFSGLQFPRPFEAALTTFTFKS